MARKRGHQETGCKHALQPPDRGRKRQKQDIQDGHQGTLQSGKSRDSQKLETSTGSRTRSTQSNEKTASVSSPRTRSSICEKTKPVSSPEDRSSHHSVRKSDKLSSLPTSGIQKELLPTSKKSPGGTETEVNQGKTSFGFHEELLSKSKESPVSTETEINQRAHIEQKQEDGKCQQSNYAQLTPQKKCRRKSTQKFDEQIPGFMSGQSKVADPEDEDTWQRKPNISDQSDNQVVESADTFSLTLTPDQGRRFSGRVRKLTQKAAEARVTFKPKFRSKATSPKTQLSKPGTQLENAIELPTAPLKQVTTEVAIICADTVLNKDKEEGGTGSSVHMGSGPTSDDNIANVQLSAVQTDSCVSPSGEVEETVSSSAPEPALGNSDSCPSSQSSSYPSHETLNTISVLYESENVLSNNHSTGCCSSYQNTDEEIPESESSCHGDSGDHGDHLYNASLHKTLQHSVLSMSKPLDHNSVSVVADRGVQASLLKDSCNRVSTGIQVDCSYTLPCRQAQLDSDTHDDEDPTSNPQQSSPFSTGLPNVNLASLLALPEAGEKVLGGVSALVKDSLLQIQGMRHFITHDLPTMTSVACFQTADKIAISGTIQGVCRAWSILSNIEHHIQQRDLKSKKAVQIQWITKAGVKKVIEFKRPVGDDSVSPTKSPKPLTVMVDIKTPEKRTESANMPISPLRKSPQTHSTSDQNNSKGNIPDLSSKKQVSLLSGKSYSYPLVDGLPLAKDGEKQTKDADVGSDGTETEKQTSCAPDLADDKTAKADGRMEPVAHEDNGTLNNIDIKNLIKKKIKASLERNEEETQTDLQDDLSDCGYDDDVHDEDRDSSGVDAERVIKVEKTAEDHVQQGDTVIYKGRDRNDCMIMVTKRGEYVCEYCPETFPTEDDLASHKVHEHDIDEAAEESRSFVECKTCSQRFRCHLELHRHQRRAHSLVSLLPKTEPSVNHSCNVCGKKFSEKRYLTTHLKRHTGIKKHKCDTCGWRFFEAHKLKFHLETHKRQEDRQLPYRCVICLRQYHNRQSWNDHMNTHTGAKPYKCNACPSTFAHRIGLHRHKLTHEKECPFKCPYCSRGFKVKANLNAHITMHTGISKHTCNACGKVFTVATSLRRHKCQPISSKQASPEKETEEQYTYMCGVCNMTFQTLELAETHSLAHVDGATGDMSLVGVQVEEVTEDTDFATSGSMDASTTYIVHTDSNGQPVTASDISAIISSVEKNIGQDGDSLVDEAEKIHIAASTLADLSTLSKDVETLGRGSVDSLSQELVDGTLHKTHTAADAAQVNMHDTTNVTMVTGQDTVAMAVVTPKTGTQETTRMLQRDAAGKTVGSQGASRGATETDAEDN
ncbi:uncharacterized protein [Haliotis cracherodii]|uniref:uncharacterized protein n=1 Tax=Haliotis cracherodii TaxID=6455 RepID=UPI0039EBF98B